MNEEYKLIKKFDSIDRLDECIYCELYYTKRKVTALVNCILCDKNESKHKMQRIDRSCCCFDETCDLKIKVLSCHRAKKYYVYAKGLHPGKIITVLDENSSVQSFTSGGKTKSCRKYKSIPFLSQEVYLQVFSNCDYTVINDEFEIQEEIREKNLNLVDTKYALFLKLIKFEHCQSLSFVKSFLKNEITDEYSQVGFQANSSDYYPVNNCVRYVFTCKKCVSNKIISWYYIEKNLLLVQSNGNLCDCKLYKI